MENFIPVFTAHILKQSDVIDTGIVDENIKGAVLFADQRKQFFTVFHFSHISEKGGTTDLIAGDLFLRLKKLALPMRAVDDDVISFFCKFYGDRLSDSAGSTRYKYYFFCHTNTLPFLKFDSSIISFSGIMSKEKSRTFWNPLRFNYNFRNSLYLKRNLCYTEPQ